MTLAELFDRDDPALPRAAAGLGVSALALDSREVRPGGAFLACRGTRGHGLDHVSEALERGALAVLWEPAPGRDAPVLPEGRVAIAVPDLARRASRIAGRFHGHPSLRLTVIGVTGTNGKTTCAWLIAEALERSGHPSAYIGTLGAARGGRLRPGALTTPDAVTVQGLLAGFRDAGATHVAMEVSSHALDQSRVADVRFSAAALTNLTRDHLDYHGTLEAYAAAKSALFDFHGLEVRVLNADDGLGASLLERHPDAIAYTTRGTPPATSARRWLRAGDARADATGLAFTLQSSWGEAEVRTALVGEFNLANALLVAGVLLGLGIPLEGAAAALSGIAAPPGRMQVFGGGDAPLVAVDYAHTPDALRKALTALRAHCSGRLWCVFGCGGDRDRGKRAEMGEIAATLADELLVTDDNPRSENPAAIVTDILQGTGSAPVRVIHDRAAAIACAVRAAAAGDAVLVAGKGHEDVQIVGRERRPFSDAREVAASLERRSWA